MSPTSFAIRTLAPSEPLPWALLLLADPAKELVRDYIHQSRICIAEADGAVVGVCAVQPQSAERAEVRNLAVAPECRGRGIAKALLHFAADQEQQQGLRILRVCTGNSSLGPLALYQKFGFELVDMRRHYFTQHYPEPIWEDGIRCQHLLVLEKDLST